MIAFRVFIANKRYKKDPTKTTLTIRTKTGDLSF